MIEAAQIREILATYKKYGWKLERVLLAPESDEKLRAEMAADFGAAEIIASDTSAAWFSRPALNGGETWELRHLSPNPYALLEVFDAEDDEDVREETLMELEERLRQTLGKKRRESH